jgi:hypothetical protein
MDALSVRNRGKRAAPKRKGAEPFNVGPSIGLASTGKPGEFKLNMNQIEAIQQLYTSSPAIAAARSVLRGQLLGGGIVLRRGGEDVTLKPEFQRYLSSKWLGFAGDVLDSFLCWGLCVVAYDEDLDLKRQAQRVATKGSKPEPVLAPMVPPRECIEIAFRQTGKMGYTRTYIVYNLAGPVHVTKVDEDARVFIRQQPDAVGNVVSPMATVFEMGAQIQALNELALTAEITLARPRIWTQERLKKDGQQVETQNLFFDSESRQIQTDLDNSDNAEQTRSLAMQTQLVGIINKLQQAKTDNPNGFDHIRGSFSGKGVASGSTSHVPPEVAPSVFNVPKVSLSFTPTLPTPHNFSPVPAPPAESRSGAVGGHASPGPRRPRAAVAAFDRAVWQRLWRALRPPLLWKIRVQVDGAVRARPCNPTPAYDSLTPPFPAGCRSSTPR